MSLPKLASLIKVDLREAWKSESGHFTPWLAQEDNIKLLSEKIGIDLEVEATEKNVGPFRADILCKDTTTGDWVLIENQLEKTDHTHMGQLLTYAAGLSAVTIVWIAEQFTEEHRAAIDWLNEITEERIALFGLEIELWQIADSPYAPKFNIVSKPNNWSNTVTIAKRQIEFGELSEIKQLQLEFWTELNNYLKEKSNIKRPKPLPINWTTFSIGRSNFIVNAVINTRDKVLSVVLLISGIHAKTYYRLLEKDKITIEQEAGIAFEWRELPDNKESHIVLRRYDFDLTNKKEWINQHEWLKKNLELFLKVFSNRIKNLNIHDYIEET